MTDSLIKFSTKDVKAYNEYFHLVDEKTGQKLSDIPYRLHRPSTGESFEGKTEAKGRTQLAHTGENPDDLHLHYTGDEEVNHGW